ncbi:MAG: hypothetical protein ACXWSR_20470 [Bdellovibrionota bacterium]
MQGLAGATRAGVTREALFSNPASVANIENTFGFFHYEMPKIPDYNAGGRSFNAGLYDGGDKTWKGGFGYSRIAKARIINNHQGYIDRREFRFSSGHEIYSGVTGGIAGRYIKNYNDSDSGSFLEADAGVLFPLFNDLHGGLTFENILNREDETPQTIGAGAAYSFGYGIQVIADGYRLMSGTKNGERGWSLAGELGLTGDVLARAGIFEEAYRGLKGWSLGASWIGPRIQLDYALKTAGKGPKEKSHIFGLTMSL